MSTTVKDVTVDTLAHHYADGRKQLISLLPLAEGDFKWAGGVTVYKLTCGQ